MVFTPSPKTFAGTLWSIPTTLSSITKNLYSFPLINSSINTVLSNLNAISKALSISSAFAPSGNMFIPVPKLVDLGFITIGFPI